MSLARTEWARHLIYNPFIGCRAGGTSTGCKNCTARHTAMRNAYAFKNGSVRNAGFGHEACTHVLKNLENEKKVAWNGKVIYNPYATQRLEKLVSPREILVNMSGDVGCANPEKLGWLLHKITSKRLEQHFFTLVTKYPEVLEEALHGIKTPRNLGVYVSVEAEKLLHRVEVLRRLEDTILKGVWLKPLVGPFNSKVDFTGMLDVVVSGEIANNHRPMRMEDLVKCAQAANTANANFTIEALSAKDWLSAKERAELKRLKRELRRRLKAKRKK